MLAARQRVRIPAAVVLRAASTTVPGTAANRKINRRVPNESLLGQSYSVPQERSTTSYRGLPLQPCVAVTSCESYDLEKVRTILSHLELDTEEIVRNEAVHFRYQADASSVSDVFVLQTGTIVSWGLSEQNVVDNVLPLFNEAMTTPYEVQTEDMDYIEFEQGGAKKAQSSTLEQEIICIAGDPRQKMLDKLAFSYGISRSTRLAVLESSLEKHIQLTRNTTENLSKGKQLGIGAREVLRSSGRLLLLRGKLNLYSELVETPDLYWTEPNLEKIYNDVSRALDLSTRISILNRKLDYCSDEARALLDILTTRKGTRLEWIVIYLIMIEVMFEIHHFYERYYDNRKQETTVYIEKANI
ncbi:hypothetical protein OGAPHI_002497 [Ogataea philodendri]|uniref:DUF155 domain-containing protein n=1 Tax=Ogataea philodendri TaxID=1378263 RepID=A0A9P8PCG7_9ASCO|nr:uncharacterized protein OGAPHI_002497 [Ogataea philodendri]KAH3668742.1 hypothetical protein OGAPHI_002497 [Ogataea philodendri]